MFVQEKKKVRKEQISKEVPYKKNLRSHAQLSDTSDLKSFHSKQSKHFHQRNRFT